MDVLCYNMDILCTAYATSIVRSYGRKDKVEIARQFYTELFLINHYIQLVLYLDFNIVEFGMKPSFFHSGEVIAYPTVSDISI